MNELVYGSNVAETRPVGGVVEIIVNGEQPHDFALADALAGGSAFLRNGIRRTLVVRHTTEPGHAVTLAREAALEQVERVIAVGGDGVIGEIVLGLMSVDLPRRPALGIVAHGTANDFATSAGISPNFGRALREAIIGTPRSVDVGRLASRSGSHWFLNMVTGGVLRETRSEARTQLVGGLAYAVAGIIGLPAMQSVDVKLRGESFAWSGPIYALAVGNGRTVGGGGFGLCPDASIVDGEFEVTVIPASLGFADVLELIDDRGVAGVRAIPRFRSPWVELEADTNLHLSIDGEPHSISDGRFAVSCGLEVVLPSTSPLLLRPTP